LRYFKAGQNRSEDYISHVQKKQKRGPKSKSRFDDLMRAVVRVQPEKKAKSRAKR
jgi:hypothetical protein